jgi:hypothetical protein
MSNWEITGNEIDARLSFCNAIIHGRKEPTETDTTQLIEWVDHFASFHLQGHNITQVIAK